MNGHRRLVGLLGGLAALGVGSLAGQDIGVPPDARLIDWLAGRVAVPESVAVLDARTEGGIEALVLRVPLEGYRLEYWTLTRAIAADGTTRRLGVLGDQWGDPSIEAVVDGDVYVHAFTTYAPYLHRYRPRGDGSVEESRLPVGGPGPIALSADSVYGAWSHPGAGQVALAVSRADGGARTYFFGGRRTIEEIRIRGDTVAFLTAEEAIVRHRDGGWGGYHRSTVPYDPPGVRVLHPSLPQFRVVDGGLAEVRLGDTLYIPLDFPDFEQFRRARPDHLPGADAEDVDIAVEIGPVTDDGRRVWFGLTFYDGEGMDGVGGLGWLDPVTREAELIYPPAMAGYSVTSIQADRGRILLGLAVRPEGATSGAGLAEYDPASGDLTRILEAGHITGIATEEGRIFAVSDQGLLEVDTARDTGVLVRRWLVLPPAGVGEPVPVVVRTDLRAP